MTVSKTLTSLMDRVREFQFRSDKLSLQDLQLMLDSISALKFGKDQYASDNNYTRNTGIYFCNSGVTNKPVSGEGLLVVLSPGDKGWAGGTATQFFVDVNNRQFYKRSMNEKTVWTSWNKLDKAEPASTNKPTI